MPWRPGQSGNPRGRPRKDHSVTEVLEKLALARRTGAPVTRIEELCQKLYEMAIQGDVTAARLILAYLEGKPIERVQAAVREMPPFTADEAAEAERKLREFRARLAARGTSNESTGAS